MSMAYLRTALTYLGLSRHRLNLTIRGGVHARRVIVDGNTAVGVEVDSRGDRFSVYGREIILCGGAINSPQLLMLSGIGPREHLKGLGIPVVKDLPGVGENLRDHPAVFLLYRTRLDANVAEEPFIQVGMRYTSPGSEFRNDVQMSPVLLSSEHRPTNVEIPADGSYSGFSIGLQKALTAGRIRLTSADPHQQPSLDYRYLSDPRDVAKMRGAVRLCIELCQRPELSESLAERVTPSDEELADDDALDRWLMANVGTQHHSSGTCKMGPPSDGMAVVDQYLRVHGLSGLRVVDASVMPDVVRANTNATTIMIAEKAADWIGRAGLALHP
jgi:choline dehydrogenase